MSKLLYPSGDATTKYDILLPLLQKIGYTFTGTHKLNDSQLEINNGFSRLESTEAFPLINPDFYITTNEKIIFWAKALDNKVTISSESLQRAALCTSLDIKDSQYISLYLLCNNQDLIIYKIDRWTPLFQCKVVDIDYYLDEITLLLSKENLERLLVKGYKLDYGLTLIKLGFDSNVEISLNNLEVISLVRLKTSQDLEIYSANCTTQIQDRAFTVTIDFEGPLLLGFFENIPWNVQDAFRDTFSQLSTHKMILFEATPAIKISVIVYLDTNGQEENYMEDFVPFRVVEFIF